MLYDQWLVRAHKWDLTVLSQKSRHALLAQLVEQLTLNQRAQGSSPWKCTRYPLSREIWTVDFLLHTTSCN